MVIQKHIGCVIGTRPEAIKMAPVIKALMSDAFFRVTIICSAQHRQLLDETLAVFQLIPDIDLNIMKENQTVSGLSGALCFALEDVAKASHYDAWLVQGDTTTCFIASLIAFYHRIPVGHVEAGLRTGDQYEPFPEEMNRVLTSRLATWHFAPTELDKLNLLNEGINPETIHVVGNTVIDALYQTISQDTVSTSDKKILLATIHRRENFGKPLVAIFNALLKIALHFPDINIIYPVHPNPNVKTLAYKMLSDCPNIALSSPLEYNEFCNIMHRAYLILSDSGGVQEEAPALGKPVLILREKTERPLVVMEGAAKLVGTNADYIFEVTKKMLLDAEYYQSFVKKQSPYGDGTASRKILKILKNVFQPARVESKVLVNHDVYTHRQ